MTHLSKTVNKIYSIFIELNKDFQLIKFIINGLMATGTHYTVLKFFLFILGEDSIFISDFLGAVVGITVSFLGNKYFVFRKRDGMIFKQALLFVILYGILAVLHGIILTSWEMYVSKNLLIGFLIATFVQVSLSYVGNKMVIFHDKV
jgi:putative flippase GtrA